MLAPRKAGPFGVALACLIGVACAKFSGEEPPPGAGPIVPEAGAPDAPDGAGPMLDAGDASPLPDSFCATIVPPPIFCDDFDGPEPLASKWPPPMTVGNGADVSRDEDALVSAPRSLKAEVGQAAIDGAAYVERPLAGLTARVQLDYDILVVTYDGTSPLPFNNLVVGNLRLNLAFGPGKVKLGAKFGNTTGQEYTVNGLEDFKRWHHVTIVVERSLTPTLVTVKVDNVTRLDQQALDERATDLPTGSVMAGIYYTKPPKPVKIRVDNVVVRAL